MQAHGDLLCPDLLRLQGLAVCFQRRLRRGECVDAGTLFREICSGFLFGRAQRFAQTDDAPRLFFILLNQRIRAAAGGEFEGGDTFLHAGLRPAQVRQRLTCFVDLGL